MRSLPLLRLSVAACGVAALATVGVHLANLSISLPVQQLRVAWTLARVLIQL